MDELSAAYRQAAEAGRAATIAQQQWGEQLARILPLHQRLIWRLRRLFAHTS